MQPHDEGLLKGEILKLPSPLRSAQNQIFPHILLYNQLLEVLARVYTCNFIRVHIVTPTKLKLFSQCL